MNSLTLRHCISTLNQSGSTMRARSMHSNLFPKDYNDAFDNSLPKIIKKVVSGKKCLDSGRFEDLMKTATDINMKNNISNNINNLGGITLLHAYRLLERPKNITPETESFQHALVLAWAVEMVNIHSVMLESIELQEDAKDQMLAGNITKNEHDADSLRSFLNAMLEEYFESELLYKVFLKMYNKAFIYKSIARDFERTQFNTSNKFLNFTEDRYDLLCNYKSGYPKFTLPVSVAVRLVDKVDEKAYTSLHRLCSHMGKFHQMQKDFTNCFGDEALIGTAGTDIQKGKCTWLAVTALQRFTPRQRIVFESCYGSAEPAHVERVKLLYDQTQLPRIYKEKQTAIAEDIEMKAEVLERDGIPSELFQTLIKEMKCNP